MYIDTYTISLHTIPHVNTHTHTPRFNGLGGPKQLLLLLLVTKGVERTAVSPTLKYAISVDLHLVRKLNRLAWAASMSACVDAVATVTPGLAGVALLRRQDMRFRYIMHLYYNPKVIGVPTPRC